eukprot:GEMP01015898.1.p1 GENE.GEMP01015898.1~~GEMP01015898.1.p1  ORF type:complete len:415 (+),score=79.70 GEMP01015898.1:65-1309(+)
MKGIALALMIVVAVMGVIVVPWFLKKRHIEFIFGQAMAAGVLLVAAFLHLLPEAIEFSPKPRELTAGIICVGTFVALILIESTAMALWGKPEKNGGGSHQNLTASKSPSEPASIGVGALCLFFALGVHSVIEGFALGAQDNIQNMTTTLISIVAHKGLAGLALGQALLKARYRVRTFVCMGIVFSLLSPIGLAIGWGLNWTSCHPGVGVANAMAAGTFLFSGAFEMLPHIFEKRGKIVQKSLGLLVGAGLLMLLIVLLEGGTHEHNCPGAHDHGDDGHDDHGTEEGEGHDHGKDEEKGHEDHDEHEGDNLGEDSCESLASNIAWAIGIITASVWTIVGCLIWCFVKRHKNVDKRVSLRAAPRASNMPSVVPRQKSHARLRSTAVGADPSALPLKRRDARSPRIKSEGTNNGMSD